MTAATFGYARVSTGQQLLDGQLDALRNAGCERVFTDKISGVRADRPGLLECLDRLRPGDTLVVVALDRLGRSVLQVVGTLTELHDRGVVVRSLRENLDLSTPTGKVVAAMFAALAELERELIRERAAAAREAARLRGRQVGRPPVLTMEQAELAGRMRRSGEPYAVIARTLGCSRATVYRVIEKGLVE
ncbi:recombinase family protein [Nocardioides sp. HDW12B]|uniref:recombinase family protein n=1 Tax=Nocardioides sp. HDW12B TaxID=2714939 RepID=UPI001F0FBDF7|nr:recombinase family protein [Nocardioides sp. HDW12B]